MPRFMEASNRKAEIEALALAYPSIPLEALLKQDLLRLGLRFTQDSLALASGFKPKDYFIFSFDYTTLAEMQEHCQALLANAGLQQYEISAYSQPGHQCQHNQ